VTVMSQANATPFRAPAQTTSWSAISQGSTEEAQVKLQREGDHVSAIRIQCTCGRIVELACLYENAPTPGTAPRSDPAAGGESTTASPHDAAPVPQPGSGGDAGVKA
jgi:hypothetical protein